MSVVYKALDARLGRFVALKLPLEQFHEDGCGFERLQQEARTASALNHPGICTIYDMDADRGQPFIVMEFIEGQTLREKLSEGPQTLLKTLRYGVQIAEALGNAHARGIVHCDINPSNLFITRDDRVKLLDFGIARFLSASRVTARTLTGTVSYMSPEQARLRTVDARSDIFSVGIVLYEMLTCRRPFRGANVRDTIQQVIFKDPCALRAINPKIPVAVENAVNRCLRKSAQDRYQTVEELRLELLKVRLRKSAFSLNGRFTVGDLPAPVAVKTRMVKKSYANNGHEPVVEQCVNRTICIDSGCVSEGSSLC